MYADCAEPCRPAPFFRLVITALASSSVISFSSSTTNPSRGFKGYAAVTRTGASVVMPAREDLIRDGLRKGPALPALRWRQYVHRGSASSAIESRLYIR